MQRLDDREWTFAPARPEDVGAMSRLAHSAYRLYTDRIGREPAPMTSDYALIASSGRAMLARRDGRLEGMLVTELDGDALLVENIAVDPAVQGSGLGSALLAEAEGMARRAGKSWVRLYTNEAMVENLAFYPRRGYTETHRAVEDGYSRVYFAKRMRTPRRADVTTTERIGGPERLELLLLDHDDRWRDTYLDHRRRITEALVGVRLEVEHIGSTSVPGLAAKPIVDIVVVVDDITAEEDYLDALLTAGYLLRVREPGHRLVRTPARDIHVHIYERGAPAVDDYLLLRDRLRTNAEDRALYETTKRALLDRQWDDMNDYADAKTDVILAIKARARAARG